MRFDRFATIRQFTQIDQGILKLKKPKKPTRKLSACNVLGVRAISALVPFGYRVRVLCRRRMFGSGGYARATERPFAHLTSDALPGCKLFVH
jgi:hypothetical protein